MWIAHPSNPSSKAEVPDYAFEVVWEPLGWVETSPPSGTVVVPRPTSVTDVMPWRYVGRAMIGHGWSDGFGADTLAAKRTGPFVELLVDPGLLYYGDGALDGLWGSQLPECLRPSRCVGGGTIYVPVGTDDASMYGVVVIGPDGQINNGSNNGGIPGGGGGMWAGRCMFTTDAAFPDPDDFPGIDAAPA